MKSVLMISGYKRTGKDTFFDHEWQFFHCKNLGRRAYEKDSNLSLEWSHSSYSSSSSYNRVAFADKLKEICRDELYPSLTLEEMDILKDEGVVGTKTIRDNLIEIASRYRSIDEDYWAKEAMRGRVDDDIYITDWRYPNEVDIVRRTHKVTTMRLFRSCISTPTSPSELALDEYKADILCVTSQQDFEECIRRLPQYTSYTPL